MSQSIQTPEGHPGPAASVASSALSPMAAFSARHQTLPAGNLKSKLIKGLAIGAGLLTLACSANFWLADNYFGSPAAAPANQVGTGYAQELKEADNEGEVLVVADLQDGTTYEEAQALAERYNLDFKYNSPYSGGNALFVTSIKAKDLDSTLQKLAQEPLVEAAEPNYVYKLTPPATDSKTNSDSPLKASGAVFNIPNQPNDPLYKYQWNFQMLNVPQAWTWSRGRGAVAAVIDTGVAWQAAEDRPAMEDLAQTKIVKGYDFVNHNDLALDDNCHGTHVAGTIAQSTNNELGVAGIANEAAIMPIKVLSGMGQKLEPVFQIGKNGVTDTTISELSDVLEARELIKISVLRNCDFTAKELINDLAETLMAEPVSCVGSKIVLYRRSERKDVKHIEF